MPSDGYRSVPPISEDTRESMRSDWKDRHIHRFMDDALLGWYEQNSESDIAIEFEEANETDTLLEFLERIQNATESFDEAVRDTSEFRKLERIVDALTGKLSRIDHYGDVAIDIARLRRERKVAAESHQRLQSIGSGHPEWSDRVMSALVPLELRFVSRGLPEPERVRQALQRIIDRKIDTIEDVLRHDILVWRRANANREDSRDMRIIMERIVAR